MFLQLRLGRILLHHDLGYDSTLDFTCCCLGHVVREIDLRYDQQEFKNTNELRAITKLFEG